MRLTCLTAAAGRDGRALAAAQDNPANDGRGRSDPLLVAHEQRGAVRIGETFDRRLDLRGARDRRRCRSCRTSRSWPIRRSRWRRSRSSAGSHPPDLRSGQRRFFQYQYSLRIINPDVIGQDVPLPNLVVHYRVNSRLPGNAAMQGRDLSYLLPPQTDPRPVAGAVRCRRHPRRIGRELRPGRVARSPRGRVRGRRGHVRRARLADDDCHTLLACTRRPPPQDHRRTHAARLAGCPQRRSRAGGGRPARASRAGPTN